MTATLVLRKEFKSSERRTPLTPNDAKKLIDQGHIVKVESLVGIQEIIFCANLFVW